MTIRSFRDKTPTIAETAWISEAAYVLGDVEIGDGSSVWPGAVIRADFAPIRIGPNSHVEDNSVLHVGTSLTIGENCIIGHGVIIHCKSIGNNCLIGNNATILEGAEIEDFCIVAAGALVPPGMKVPARSMLMGVPAAISELSPGQMERLESQSPDTSVYARLAQRYKKEGL